MVQVANFRELVQAITAEATEITITRNIIALHSLKLPAGVVLNGAVQENLAVPMLLFTASDGIGVTSNNQIRNLNIQTAVDQRAIYNAGQTEDLGSFVFEDLTIVGQFSFIMRAGSLWAALSLDNVNIVAADARKYLEQPQKYGVNVLQGALTVYNFNPNADSRIKLKAQHLTIGQKNAPVIGSGVFISGAGDQGGRVEVSMLMTNHVYSTGLIPEGVANIITGAIFIVYGAYAKEIVQHGETVTYGVNDMVLDAWGSVDHWRVNGPVTSYGPSGIGFVNFGIVNRIEFTAAIQTFGLGARGYNQYDGTLREGIFQSIETFGDGSIGIQISKEVGQLHVRGHLTTHGSVGRSLVKGVLQQLPAYAISVKSGGHVENLAIAGDVCTTGAKVTSISVENQAEIDAFSISGEVATRGQNSQALMVADDAVVPPLDFDFTK
ncbi:hypothetical protein [Lapidilactobacillus wuchangensis]|uniref:hypothetical protein n=1 Tax=Lapidilactobacillus wuchangensis TaxID=2486001 RepID=UPI000F79C2D2|nr:hypothetical protein [Lapidilactobacillus wuchangensis]